MNKSIWVDDKIPEIDNKEVVLKTDILIIGGGITGLSTAYFLKNKDVTLIDSCNIGHGVTSKTTAKISYLQGNIYQKLTKKFDNELAFNYYSSQKEAIDIIKNIVNENKIDCDFKHSPSISYTIDISNSSKIDMENRILRKWNIKTYKVYNEKIINGIKVNDTYTFNPIKYMKALTKILDKRIRIYTSVVADEIEKNNDLYYVSTNIGVFICNKVVVACHYPFFLLPSLIPLKTYIKREYVNAAHVDKEHNYNAINIDNDLHSIRYYKNYLIYTSNQHRLTDKIDYKKNYEKSRKDFKKYFNLEPEYTWMNQDIMSYDELPFIGEIKPNMFIACAFNAWGMTNGTISGKIISDLILKGDSKYKELFSPKRNNLYLLAKSFVGTISYLKAYINSFFNKYNPSYIKIDGIMYGIYIDEKGVKHTVKLICPHMKCNLVFNREERTWDCPCHGSRFDIDGNLIEGPATKKIRKE